MADNILTQDQVKDLFEYRDGELYWKINKGTVKIGSKTGSLHHSGYRFTQINKKTYLLHRIIFLYHHGYLPQYIDHIDNNKINNKIENLREATRSQNGFNTRISKTNTSGIKGVNWSKSSKKWEVRVQINNKRKCIGIYADIELAELVATEARNKYHQEFARHQ